MVSSSTQNEGERRRLAALLEYVAMKRVRYRHFIIVIIALYAINFGFGVVNGNEISMACWGLGIIIWSWIGWKQWRHWDCSDCGHRTYNQSSDYAYANEKGDFICDVCHFNRPQIMITHIGQWEVPDGNPVH